MFSSGNAIVLKRGNLIEPDQDNPTYQQTTPTGGAPVNGEGSDLIQQAITEASSP